MNILKNEMRRYILEKLSRQNNLSFTELFDDAFFSSSHFNYHLKVLLDEEYVSKEEGYSLTTKGKQLINRISGSAEKLEQPIVILAAHIQHEGKILTSASKKEPYKHIWGLSCYGKAINARPTHAIKEICMQDTGLELRNPQHTGTYAIYSEELDVYHILLVFTGEVHGELIIESESRRNKWVTPQEHKELKQYPDNQYILEHLNGYHELQRSSDLLKVL